MWIATATKHITDKPEKLSTYRANIPKGIENAVLKLLHKYPKDRFKNAEDLRAVLLQQKTQLQAIQTQENLVGVDYECFVIFKRPHYFFFERGIFICNFLVFTDSERSFYMYQFSSSDQGMRLFCAIESAEPLPNSRLQTISEVKLISLKICRRKS